MGTTQPRWLALLVLVSASVATCGPPFSARHPGLEQAHAGACPLKTAEEWQAFLEGHAHEEGWVKTCEEGDCDVTFADRVDREVTQVLKACTGVFADNPGIAACTANLRSFVPAWAQQHSLTSYGFNVDNATYFAAQMHGDVPAGMMVLPAEIAPALPDLDRLKAALGAAGHKYLVHESCLASPRLFVLVPDPQGRFDQWVLLNLKGPDAGKPVSVDVTKTLSFLVVQKTDALGKGLPKVRVHFRDYAIERAPGAGFQLGLHNDVATKCASCHPSGVRKLIPQHTEVTDAAPVLGEAGYPSGGLTEFGRSRLAEFNARLMGYGLNDWNGLFSPNDQGPPVGHDEGCTRCHNGSDRGVLTVLTSVAQLQEKVLYELAMPPTEGLPELVQRSLLPSPPLTTEEESRIGAVYEAHKEKSARVIGKRRDALAAWLLATPCR